MQDNFEMVITFLKYNFTLNDLDLKPCERNNAAAGRNQRNAYRDQGNMSSLL